MLKILSAALFLAMASAALAQSTPYVTPSQTPAVTPSQAPAITPSQTSVGGLGKCENMIGAEKDKCLQDERARAAGTGASNAAPAAPATGMGKDTTDPRYTPPAGTVR